MMIRKIDPAISASIPNSSAMTANRARVVLQSGFVLHRRPFRDSSLLVELFTPQFGRVAVIARGARQPKSRLQGVLQPFRPLLLSWSGNGELPGLIAAEGDGAVPWLTGKALVGGFYLNELLIRLLHRFDPHPRLYSVYQDTVHVLGMIGQTAENDIPSVSCRLERALRLFEKTLLEEIGYGLVLEYETELGQPIEAQQLYVYRLKQGPVRLHAGVEAAAPHRLTLRGQSLLDLARGCLDDSTSLREAKRLMRAALAEQLGHRPLNSRHLFAVQHDLD
jgi:DNA repair protein RecO (recombination protein O)